VSLTGRPLLMLTGAAAVLVTAATVRLWRRRWIPMRILGLLLAEVLAVATVGLEVNRREDFYPSWQALAGDTGTKTEVRTRPPGRLDDDLAPGTAIAWRPPGWTSWRLARAPVVVAPASYRRLPQDTFPVVLALVAAAGPALAAARRVPDAVTVVAVPTRDTTAAALRSLPEELRRDVRVTTTGWDLVAASRQAELGAALAASGPPGLVASRGWHPDRLAAPLAAPLRLPS
jgi:hypothetical protein